MKSMIGLFVAILLVSGCIQTDVPKNVLEKYGENEDYTGHRTISVCNKWDDRTYRVGFNAEADGPTYYYNKNGEYLGVSSFGFFYSDNQSTGIPTDASEYRCELLNESGD